MNQERVPASYKVRIYKAVDNILFGVSWSLWGGRKTHIYLGLWVLTITTPNNDGEAAQRDPE